MLEVLKNFSKFPTFVHATTHNDTSVTVRHYRLQITVFFYLISQRRGKVKENKLLYI